MADQYRVWGKMLEEATDGRYTVKFYWGGSLLTAMDSVPGVAAGIADMTEAAASYFPAELPLGMMLEHAYNAPNTWISAKLQTELYEVVPELQAERERQNIHHISPYNSGVMQWYSNERDWTLEKAQGKIMRAFGGARAEWQKRAGLEAIFMSIFEVYEAMERGTLWGFENTLNLANDLKQLEVCESLVLVNSGGVMAGGTSINLDTWKSMSAEDREIFWKVGADWGANSQAKLFYEIESRIEKEWAEDHGVTVITPTDAEMKILRDAAAEVIVEIAAQKDRDLGLPGTSVRLIGTLLGLRDKYEKEWAKGSPW